MLVSVNRQPTIQALADKFFVEQSAILPFFESDSLHEDLELGKVSADEFVERLLSQLNLESTPGVREVEDIMGMSFGLNRELQKYIDSLRSELQVILLSNTNALDIPALERRFNLVSWADEAILSYQIHLKKPDPAIYQYALETFDLHPNRTFFLDDLPENIAAARDAGILSEVFRSNPQAKRALTNFLHGNET